MTLSKSFVAMAAGAAAAEEIEKLTKERDEALAALRALAGAVEQYVPLADDWPELAVALSVIDGRK